MEVSPPTVISHTTRPKHTYRVSLTQEGVWKSLAVPSEISRIGSSGVNSAHLESLRGTVQTTGQEDDIQNTTELGPSML